LAGKRRVVAGVPPRRSDRRSPCVAAVPPERRAAQTGVCRRSIRRSRALRPRRRDPRMATGIAPSMTAIRLTALSHGAGCACKLGPADLAQVLRHVPTFVDSRILVDASTRDDAAVFQLTPDRALVATVDFFTPIVDDAYDFGRIAATNAFSDLYAMGATPLFALNLVGWPREGLPFDLLGEVIRGGAEVARAAGAFILGGHSVDDPEPKY